MAYSCTVMRRKKVTTTTLSLVTGKRGPESHAWLEEPCGVPLFGKAEQEAGKCRSCAKGWTHPDNYPVEGK
jgi:hypothetical protein